MANDQSKRLYAPPRKGVSSRGGDHLGKIRGRVNSYLTFGTVDGPGIRFVLFLQGCPLRCLYCHNPDSVCGDAGEAWTVDTAFAAINRYRRFIRSGGVTFSGGEPLAQPEFVRALAVFLRRTGLHTALDTSGCIDPAGVRRTIDAVDMLLLDIKSIDPNVSRRLTGQDNANAFATLDYCETTGKRVWIRHVLLRGYTQDAGQLSGLAARLKRYRCVELVELLPFHKFGEEKWRRIGRAYELSDVKPTTAEEAEWAKAFFTGQGLRVQ